MKKVITFVSILCIGCLLFCGCGKKDKESNKSGVNTSEGADGVAVGDMGEETVVVDFETGSVISVPSNKTNSKTETTSSSTTTEIVTEAGEPSSASSTSSSGSSSKVLSSSLSSSSSSSTDASSEPSTPSGGSSSKDSVMGGFSPWE